MASLIVGVGCALCYAAHHTNTCGVVDIDTQTANDFTGKYFCQTGILMSILYTFPSKTIENK